MMRHVWPLALLATQAAAQDCVTAWGVVQAGAFGYDVSGNLAVDGQTCSITDLRLEAQSEFGSNVLIERLVLAGAGFGGPLDRLLAVPVDINMTVEGLRIVPVMPDPTMRYLFEAQSRGFDGITAQMVLQYDPAAGRLDLSEFAADFGALGQIAGQFQLDGLTAEFMEAPDAAVAALAIPQARLVVTTTGLFETYGLIPLGTVIATGPDPVAALSAFQAEAIAALQPFSSGLIDAESLSALTALIAALPNPRGELVVDLVAAPGAVDALVMSETLAPVPDGVTLSVTWTPIAKGGQP
jgi:hypothetical protein